MLINPISLWLQMYESDGSIMVYWHALESPETPTGRYYFTLHMHAFVDNLIILV